MEPPVVEDHRLPDTELVQHLWRTAGNGIRRVGDGGGETQSVTDAPKPLPGHGVQGSHDERPLSPLLRDP